MLESVFLNGVSIENVLICSVISIILGLIISYIYMKTSKCSKNFLITLTILPVLVQSIILMTSGNLGTSIAIVGAFSLVRFRSVPGTSREIVSVLFAMTIGLAMGMGHIMYAVIITILVGLIILLLSKTKFGEGKNEVKILKITIPENLDYTCLFDDIFEKFSIDYKLSSVKTVNLGSLFELSYLISKKTDINEKELIDELRSRNGNLKIILSHSVNEGEL